MLWDLKFRPAKENAAASEPEDVFDVEYPGLTLDKLVEEALAEACLRCTESCKLLARAFSCWRMNWAND